MPKVCRRYKMMCSINISRSDYPDAVFIVSRSQDERDKKLFYAHIRGDMLFDTHIPDHYQQRLTGSLVALLLKDPKVINVAIQQDGDGRWIADAVLQYGTGWKEYYRGEGNNPLAAVSQLVLYLMFE
jgi:hypothetical protein